MKQLSPFFILTEQMAKAVTSKAHLLCYPQEAPMVIFSSWVLRIQETITVHVTSRMTSHPSVCSDNILVLDIYFEALNYETIEQKKAYELAGLLGKETALGEQLICRTPRDSCFLSRVTATRVLAFLWNVLLRSWKTQNCLFFFFSMGCRCFISQTLT